MAVIFLSSSFSIILTPIIPGTEHPEPIIKGIKLFPLRPIFLNILSNNKAILDIYPVVSNNDIHKNNIVSCGIKLITAPTPEITPSTIKLSSHLGYFAFNIVLVMFSLKILMVFSIQSVVNFPTTPTDK